MQTFLIATLVLSGGVAQYILMAQAIKDLMRRPRVRGDNKVLWGLVILCVPLAGALVYTWMGPTSFMRRTSDRTRIPATQPRSPDRAPVRLNGGRIVHPSNVTSIRTARSYPRERLVRPASTPPSAPPLSGNRSLNGAPVSPRKTGS